MAKNQLSKVHKLKKIFLNPNLEILTKMQSLRNKKIIVIYVYKYVYKYKMKI